MSENPKNVKIKIKDDNCIINSGEFFQKNPGLINDSKSNILLNKETNGDMEEISLSLSDTIEENTDKELEMLFLCNHELNSISNEIGLQEKKKYSVTNKNDNYLINPKQIDLNHINSNNNRHFIFKNSLLNKKKKLSLQLMSNIVLNKKYDINKKIVKNVITNYPKKYHTSNNNSNYYWSSKRIKNNSNLAHLIKNKASFQKLSSYNYNNDPMRKMNEKTNNLFTKKRFCSISNTEPNTQETISHHRYSLDNYLSIKKPIINATQNCLKLNLLLEKLTKKYNNKKIRDLNYKNLINNNIKIKKCFNLKYNYDKYKKFSIIFPKNIISNDIRRNKSTKFINKNIYKSDKNIKENTFSFKEINFSRKSLGSFCKENVIKDNSALNSFINNHHWKEKGLELLKVTLKKQGNKSNKRMSFLHENNSWVYYNRNNKNKINKKHSAHLNINEKNIKKLNIIKSILKRK